MPFIADAHADTFLKVCFSQRKWDMFGLPPRLQVTGDRMREGGLNLEVFATFVPPGYEDRAPGLAVEMMERGKAFLEAENIGRIETRADLEEIRETGGTGGILSLEGALPLGEDPGMLEEFYHGGVRLLTLAWSRRNAFASGIEDSQGGGDTSGWAGRHGEGLTEKGRDLLELAAQLGVVVDVSHLNDRGTEEVLELTDLPVVASHSCAHSVHPNPRNLTDDMIEAIASTGGMVGVNFYTKFLNGTEEATMEDVVDHIRHMAEAGGAAAVGLGSDSMGYSLSRRGWRMFPGWGIWPRRWKGVSPGKRSRLYWEGIYSGCSKRSGSESDSVPVSIH